jgi:ribonuclease HI
VAKWAIELLYFDIKFEAKKAIKSQALADFMAEWIEQQQPIQVHSAHWTMFFDGSKVLNGSGAGVVLVSPKGDRLSYVLQIHFDSSNNEAEYEALLYGLRMDISLGVRRLMVYGDSDLVVNQVMKEWDVRNPAMTGYCNAVRKLEKKFEGLELHHVPRVKNQAADDLAKIGSTRKPVPSNVFLEHLYSPSVQENPFTEEPPQPISASNPTEVDVPAVIDLVMEILVITPDWTIPYIAYILRQELPEDEVEARQIVRRSKVFTIMDGQLYRESITGVAQRCISPKEGRLILEEIHSGTCGHHASSRTIVAKAY